ARAGTTLTRLLTLCTRAGVPGIPSPPLPIPSPPPDSPTHIEILESCLPLQKRLRFASPTPSQEIEESSATVMIEREARMAREAWGLSMDASGNAHSDVMSLHTMLVAQHALI
nr:hypothetical protein [Tanacetum cinerariifolium]